ncbi:MAG: 50S ribosomal protein L17 [Candidatus Moranbacteria bacterium]|nr:50S ribosomal protein L17 [Candidatus Moranbacteria bacterium]
MKKLKKGRTLSRTAEQRKALLNSLATSLIIHKRIETTLAKAKELRPYIEKMITKAKQEDVSRIREIRRNLSKEPTKELFGKVGPFFKNRNGGYTRILKLNRRSSDSAQIALIELVDMLKVDKDKAKQAKKAGKPKTVSSKVKSKAGKNNKSDKKESSKKSETKASGQGDQKTKKGKIKRKRK